MQTDLLLKVLDLARERNQDIMGKSYDIWAPSNDDGVQFMVNTLNEDKDADNGGLNGLEESLGPGKIFVDVGSCLGLTCLAVNNKYPGTNIVSIEPASPNWLLQELNLRCNLPHMNSKKLASSWRVSDRTQTMKIILWPNLCGDLLRPPRHDRGRPRKSSKTTTWNSLCDCAN